MKPPEGQTPVRFEYSTIFPDILNHLKSSLAIPTYQAGKLAVVGVNDEYFPNRSQTICRLRTKPLSLWRWPKTCNEKANCMKRSRHIKTLWSLIRPKLPGIPIWEISDSNWMIRTRPLPVTNARCRSMPTVFRRGRIWVTCCSITVVRKKPCRSTMRCSNWTLLRSIVCSLPVFCQSFTIQRPKSPHGGSD